MTKVIAFMETLEQIGSRQNSVVKISFREWLGSLNMNKLASLGQGGLSPEPMWDNRIPEIRALKPALIRLFIQEYFNLMPELGKYNFAALDRSVETILKTGAKPLMCICFKPKPFFPQIDQDVVEPNNWDERLVFNLVKHYIGIWVLASAIGKSATSPTSAKTAVALTASNLKVMSATIGTQQRLFFKPTRMSDPQFCPSYLRSAVVKMSHSS
jgi:hypothetical protein